MAPSLIRGHSVSFSWSAYPSRGEGSAGHFSEACPANGINPRAKLRYSSIQASFIELAEPSYYSNWPRISSTRPREPYVAESAWNQPSKPAAGAFHAGESPTGPTGEFPSFSSRLEQSARGKCEESAVPRERSTRAKQLSCGALEKRAVMLKKSPQESTLNTLLILCALKHLSSCRE